jgi:hypothetical protein
MRLLLSSDSDSIAAIVFGLVQSVVRELYQDFNIASDGLMERGDANRNGDHVREFTLSFQI